MLHIRAGIHKMLVRIANREDPDQSGRVDNISQFHDNFSWLKIHDIPLSDWAGRKHLPVS